MRWNDLFGDLEGQLEAARQSEFDSEVAERAESERATVEFAARLLASRDTEVSLALVDGATVRGVVADAAAQWALIDDGPRQHLVPVAAITRARGLASRAAEIGEVARRLPLGYALRALARDRVNVSIASFAGQCSGVITAVGRDHCDVRTEAGDEVAVTIARLVRVTSV